MNAEIQRHITLKTEGQIKMELLAKAQAETQPTHSPYFRNNRQASMDKQWSLCSRHPIRVQCRYFSFFIIGDTISCVGRGQVEREGTAKAGIF